MTIEPGVITQVVFESIELVRRMRLRHMLVGAWALTLWGRPRATTDVDILIWLGEGTWDQLRSRAERAGFELDEIWDRYNPMLRGLQRRFHKTNIPVDFLAARDAHDLRALQRRRLKMFAGRRLAVVAPEDLILEKLKVGRPRDFDDAASVIERCGQQLNQPYLRTWARRLGMTGELEYLLAHFL